RPIFLRATLAVSILIDYLGRTRHTPQTATQIAAGVRASLFYQRHGMNSGVVSRRKFSRSGIKEYVKRKRQAIGCAFREAGLHMDPKRVLISVSTVWNQTLYQLRARVEWVHLNS